MHSRSRSPLFREGWNVALQAVVRSLHHLPKTLMAELNGSDALEAVGTMVGAMAAPPARYLATNRVLARKYGVSPRTITNWRREGCPFGAGKGAVLKWVAHRRYAPPGMEKKFEHRLFYLRVRKWSGEIEEGFAERRRLKLLRKHYGVPPDPDDKSLRCPKGGMSDPKVLALKRRIDASLRNSSLPL